ncbi:putative transmembrane protein [Cercophora newfieldiana]|uniref:Transmembrane protein n=1 Tax=Cercophora newfieldiana TaxID=92897 RepID=A0AA39Y834_9PEZI|nr:putative transmembrane protein [Cercophora newfieldiana]
MDNSTLHHAIISSFLKRQRPPTVHEIASEFECSDTEARHGLRTLADYHGVVLHPHSDEIWVAHPFSAAPTTCVVSSGTQKWWGNCVWCSLGLMHLVGGTATLETRTGAIGESATVRVENGELLDTDFVVHFPVPMRRAWDNVLYTCSIQLLFRDESEVDEWCDARGVAKGDVRPIEQIWAFAGDWYGRHAEPGWMKWTMEEAADIFRGHGLSGPIWTLEGGADHF